MGLYTSQNSIVYFKLISEIIRLLHHLFYELVLFHKVFALTCRLHNNNLNEFVLIPTVVSMMIKYYDYLFLYVNLTKGNIYGLVSHHGIASPLYVLVLILP